MQDHIQRMVGYIVELPISWFIISQSSFYPISRVQQRSKLFVSISQSQPSFVFFPHTARCILTNQLKRSAPPVSSVPCAAAPERYAVKKKTAALHPMDMIGHGTHNHDK